MNKAWMLVLLLTAGCYPEGGRPGPREPGGPTNVPPAVGARGTDDVSPETVTPGTAPTGVPDQIGETDARTAAALALTDIHQMHVHELELARLATQKSKDPGILAYAETMTREHTGADADLVLLASKEGIVLESADPARYQDRRDTVERLRGLEGEPFEQAYVQEIIQDHDKALALIQMSITTVQDPELKAYFEKIQPTMKEHFDRAKALRQAEKGA